MVSMCVCLPVKMKIHAPGTSVSTFSEDDVVSGDFASDFSDVDVL